MLRLRWVSLVGQVGVCVFVVGVLDMVLPLPLLALCMGFTALNNALVGRLGRRLRPHASTVCLLLIIGDTLVLTAMLYATGGANNPFTAIYLLHVTVAAILLPPWGPWLVVGLCGGCFALLFVSPHHLVSASGSTCCSDIGSHLRGMLFSMVFAGAGIAYFVSRLSSNLTRHRIDLDEARAVSARNEHFGALATLAAGLAHELATPLGTIAVVSADLEKQVDGGCRSEACRSDAALIRREVVRCRNILERLGNEALQSEKTAGVAIEPSSLSARLAPYLGEGHFRRLQVRTGEGVEEAFVLPEVGLLQCLAVLVKNACEAGGSDGAVFLGVESRGAEVCFTVTDTGSGMSEEVVSRLGEPFFSTKEPGIGMGLGLFLVRTFVARHHGTLEVDSVPGRGTEVRLLFPRSGSREEGRLYASVAG